MNYHYCQKQLDKGPNCYVTNIEQTTLQNQNFRTAIWTGCYLQMTVMCIPPCGEIGLEIHTNTEQFIRIEDGNAIVKMGTCKNHLDFQQHMCKGDAVLIPAGTWHNIINTNQTPLKVSVLYAPPNHPIGTIHFTKSDAQRADY